MPGFRNSNSTKHKRRVLLVGFSAGLLALIASVLCIILSIKTLKKNKRRKGIVPTGEITETAEAAEAIRVEEGGALEKKAMSTEKSDNLVFFKQVDRRGWVKT